MAGVGETGQFGWVRQNVGEAGCLTLVESTDLATVAESFGGEMGAARTMDLRAMERTFMGRGFLGRPVVALRQVGEWVLVVESEFQGSRTEVLRRVSAGTRVVSAYWNVNALTQFSYAVDGRLLTAFEAPAPGQRHGDEPDALEAVRAELPWGEADSVSLMLALAARVTGQVVLPEWLDGALTVVPVTPWANDVIDAFNPDHALLPYEDGQLAFALRTADPASQQRVAQLCARYAIERAELGALPALVDAPFAPGAASPAQRMLLDDLSRELQAKAYYGSRDRPSLAQFRVVEAVRVAMTTNPVGAAFKSYAAADLSLRTVGRDPEPLRSAVLAALGDPPRPAGSLGLTAPTQGTPSQRYGWLSVHWMRVLGWIGLVRSDDVERVAQSWGADLSATTTGPVTLTRTPTVALRQHGLWVVVFEIGKPMRPLEPALAAVEAPELVSVRWHLNGNSSRFWHVVDGTLTTAFEPNSPRRTWGSAPTALNHLRTGLLDEPAGPDHLATNMLALLERVTALAFRPEWLDESYLIAPLRPR